MANPQKENGYIPIANELYDAMISFRVPGECEQVLKAIIRKTYGFNKREDIIANSQFVEMTGMKKGNVSRAVVRLLEHKLVIRSDNRYRINKDYKEWVPFIIKSDNKKKLSKKKPVLSKEITKVIRSDNKVLSEVMDTKDIQTRKDILQKTGRSPAQNARQFFKGVNDLATNIESEEAQTTKTFLQELERRYPNVTKRLMWAEIRKFERYWTERNKTGTKERWEQQEVFEVDRRLVTWFGKVKEFQNKIDIISTRKKILL